MRERPAPCSGADSENDRRGGRVGGWEALRAKKEARRKRRAGYKRILLGEHGAGKVAVTSIREKDNNGLPRVFRALG